MHSTYNEGKKIERFIKRLKDLLLKDLLEP